MQRKGKGKKLSLQSSNATATYHTSVDLALCHVREQAEIACGELKEAREQAGEETSKEALREAARSVREHIAVSRKELQSQQAEAMERERIAKRHRQEEEWARDSTATIQRFVHNSFVKFGAGLVVQNTICGFEAFPVLVKSLPMDATSEKILDLFIQQGIKQDDLALLHIEDIDGCQQATVLGNATDVDAVAVGLNCIEFRDHHLEFVVRERTSEGRTIGVSNRNSCHLTISWRPSFLTMIARYVHLEVWEIGRKARELDRRFLDGQQIRAELNWEKEWNVYDPYEPPIGRARVIISRVSSAITIQKMKNFAGLKTSKSLKIHPHIHRTMWSLLCIHICAAYLTPLFAALPSKISPDRIPSLQKPCLVHTKVLR